MLGPRPLPRLDLDDGVPSRLRTLVVVPTLLTSAADVEAQVGGLEVHYLGNREGDLRFALLSDWLDAPTEHVPGDDELLAAAAAAIDRLNERHGEAPGGGARFLLFHRKRSWNEAEGCWMGWERKRGKLHELNALLRGSTTTGILTTGRAASTPPTDVRYVVTLDADTRLPRGAVGRLVGTIAHPLNQPTFDPRAGRVTQGYGVLQPRITSTLPAEHEASIFQRIFSGSAGIDPYASAVSDVYQDLFGEGSYTGKGIYDLDAFGAAMADRVPENALLSHDLFEGVFARAGPRDRHRALRRVPFELPGLGGPPAPLGARRLAAPALDPGPGAGRHGPAEPELHARHRPLEDGRQPAPDAVRPAHAGDARRGLDAPFGLGRPVDRVRPGRRSSSLRRCPSWRDCCRDGRASPSAATCGPWAPTSPSPRPTSASASRSSRTRRG